MHESLRPLALWVLHKSGLIESRFRKIERELAEGPEEPVDDGRPMPPTDLRVLVSGASSQRWFSERGQADATRFSALAARHDGDLASGLTVLDFGCGCGRIARWLAPVVTAGRGAFHGSDYNPRLVDWCEANLDGRYGVNRLKPPLRLDSAAFDLVYAYSVLTHLREGVARDWLGELARVLKPGGLALVTFHDETYAETCGPEGLAERLAQSPYVVLNDSLQGSNYMSAWTTRAHFTQMASAWFEVLEIEPTDVAARNHPVAVLRARGRRTPS